MTSREFTRALEPSVGYGVVVGVGAFFAVLMVGLTRIQKRFTQLDPDRAEEFITASQSIKPGLICCGIVSAWTWSATLLVSSSATYAEGLSAAYWYGVGGTIQIVIFAAVAAKVKQNASGAVTFPQIVKARYGIPTYALFATYALACAHIVTGSLVLGASATINALTGADVIACNFLLPIGIAVYVVAGGLRATFLVDFLHTVILFIVLYIFVFSIFGTSSLIGSPGRLWELLQDAALTAPVSGNAQGSYTTMKSNSGILFAANSIASGFAAVFCDQGYWQRALASRPESTSRAYMIGGVSWFAIPWVFGSAMGLSCRALLNNERFPTFPYALSDSQVSAGLVAPAAAVTLLGRGGAVAVLLVVFMAATSAASAELIAVSSILTFDVYGSVAKRPVTGSRAVTVSHITIILFAVWAGAWATILHVINVDLGWLYYVQGVVLTPAVMPIACTVMWKRQSANAAFFGTLIGVVFGMTGWMVGCKMVYGEISIQNLALPYSAICGSTPGLIFSSLASLIITWIKPDNFDWSATRAVTIRAPEDAPLPKVAHAGLGHDDTELKDVSEVQVAHVTTDEDINDPTVYATDHSGAPPSDLQSLQRVFIRAVWFSVAFTFTVGILIPIPMFATGYVFSKTFFGAWTGFSIVWILISGIFCIVLPIFESRHELVLLLKLLWRRKD